MSMHSLLLKKSQGSLATTGYFKIVTGNIFTVFNAICFALAVPLIMVGSFKNLAYLGTVLCNILIGIIQQVRAKRTIERLQLKIEPKAEVWRNGAWVLADANMVEPNDKCLLKSGRQVATDCVIESGQVEVNESLLTGESVPVVKQSGATLYAGSFIVAGRCTAICSCSGKDSYIKLLEQGARQYKAPVSKLMQDLSKIAMAAGIAAVPLGIVLFLTQSYALSLAPAVTQSTAAVLSVMPIGMMLLSSVSLAVGVINLARQGALAKDLYCIESLSRVNVLCVDKTGTLTSGSLCVKAAQGIKNQALVPLEGDIHYRLCCFAAAMNNDNLTASALAVHFICEQSLEQPTAIIPFSSERKCTQMTFSDGSWVLGAPDWVLKSSPKWLKTAVDDIASGGLRVLLLAKNDEPVAVISLADTLREGVKNTLDYFKSEGVDIAVISGDHPKTVQAVAEGLGLGAEVIDCSALQSEEDFKSAARQGLLFARVTPNKKAMIIKALQAQGKQVAMVGDGVNDIAAMKQAQCAIAMAAGADAPKQVSQLVLMNNDFAALPPILLEGRRIVNNIKRSSRLFLKKSIFSFLIAAAMLIFGQSYPFENIHWTVIGAFTVGIPAFFLALEPNNTRLSGSFILDIIREALPGALVNLLLVAVAQLIMPHLGFNALQIKTVLIYITAAVGLCVLLRSCLPLNPLRAILFSSMTVLMTAALLLGAIFKINGQPFLDILVPSFATVAIIVLSAALSYPLLIALGKLIDAISKVKGQW